MKLFSTPIPRADNNDRFGSALVVSLDRLMSDLRNLINSGKVGMLQLDVLTAEPADPQNGTIVYADGTSWNPGSGEGIYAYEAGAWVKL